jgi:hypothetical protein
MMRTILLWSLAFIPFVASAQLISGVQVRPGRAAVDEPVQITVDFRLGDAPPGCGLRLTLGDGSVRHMRADQTNMPLSISYRYPRGGEFTILAEGALFVRGLRTALACDGMKTAVVSVVDVAAEREAAARKLESEARQRAERETAEREARLELERRERESALRQARLDEERALRAREAETKRREAEDKERELAARDAELRRRELDAKATEERLRALESELRREPRKTARRAPAKPAAPAGSASQGNSRPPGTLDAF